MGRDELVERVSNVMTEAGSELATETFERSTAGVVVRIPEIRDPSCPSVAVGEKVGEVVDRLAGLV
jgi:hypothetical protein